MINKERYKALRAIAVEEEPKAPQPVERISSAFLHAHLACMTQEIQNDHKQLQEFLKKAGFIQCFATNEGYYQIPHQYC